MRRGKAHALAQRFFTHDGEHNRFAAVVIKNFVAGGIFFVAVIFGKAQRSCRFFHIGHGFALGFRGV